MRRLHRTRVLTGLAAALATAFSLLSPHAAHSLGDRRPAIEDRLLQIVREARAQRGLVGYTGHAGLRGVAREHSQEMAAANRLSHDGFTDRLDRAQPDPYESNGPPDDGFWEDGLAGCENAAYHYRAGSSSESDEELAQAFYRLWYDSPAHRECLFDDWGYGLNVAGVGLYQDTSGKWWATMEVARDATPPGGGPVPPPAAPPPAPTAQPAPPGGESPPPARVVATPKPTQAPRATPAPRPKPAPATAAPPQPPAEDCRFDFWVLRVDRC